MKVKVLVQQIMKGSENIKENMDHVWRNLEYIEETYEQMFLKTHRIQVRKSSEGCFMLLIQANRVCLGDLTGVDFPGEKHPKTCPCDIARQKEQLDQERAERRREEEKRREKEKEEEKREEQRKAVESKIEGKKRQFYR